MKKEDRRERRKLALAAAVSKAPEYSGALLSDGKTGVRDYRKCIREGWAGALSACMCLSDGEVYIYPNGVFFLHGEGASGNAVKEVCLIEKRWRVMGVGVGLYGSGYLVRPVGQKGVENMREALHDTVCELPFEGISEKASQNLAKYGLQAHQIAYTSVALRKDPRFGGGADHVEGIPR